MSMTLWSAMPAVLEAVSSLFQPPTHLLTVTISDVTMTATVEVRDERHNRSAAVRVGAERALCCIGPGDAERLGGDVAAKVKRMLRKKDVYFRGHKLKFVESLDKPDPNPSRLVRTPTGLIALRRGR